MPPLLPSAADRDKLVQLGMDIVAAWYAGTTDEYYDSATRIWQLNSAEASTTDDWDTRLGLSALCAVLYRFKQPRDVAQRQLWRRLAIETVDQWFENQQDPVTGGMWRTSVANVANDSGTITYFGFAQVAIIARCLDLPTRWATQIADALDYTVSRGDHAYYTNGNIMLLKLIGFELGALASGEDPAARARVEELWEFTVDPEAWSLANGNPNYWRGCGLRDEGGGVGYFSETSSTGNSIDHSASNVLDWIYTDAQAIYAGLGYMLYGDERYATYATMCARKMEERYNYSTNQFSYEGGSRNPGAGVRNLTSAHMVPGWLKGNAEMASHISDTINHPVQGIDVDFRRYLNVSHTAFLRGFGLVVGAAIIMAHGKGFETQPERAILTGALVRGPAPDGYGINPGDGLPYDDSPWDPDTTDLFEANNGPVSIVHYGQPWRAAGVMQSFFTTPANLCYDNGSYPCIDWSPWEVSPSEVYFTMADIVAGVYDSYITTYAQAIGAWDKPIFIRPMHEMNGTWFDGWSPLAVGGPTAADFVAAWRHIVTIFRTHAPKATFVWSPNIIDDQAGNVDYPIADLYPGDAYVDWVGMDGYAWGSDGVNKSFTDTYLATYNAIYELAAADKPLMLGEWGCDDSATVVGGSKAAWITNAFTVLNAGHQFPRIRAIVWFNRNADGQLWRLENGAGASTAHKAGVSDPKFKGADYGDATVGPIPAPTV